MVYEVWFVPPFVSTSCPVMVASVVVAVQVGIPFKSASTWPPVPAEVVASADDPLPYRMEPDCIAAQPVPPFETGKSDEPTSAARLIVAVPIFPAVAFKKPERDAMVSSLETARLVVVAFVDVALVKTAVDGVAAPIGVFSMVPAEIVRLSAT